MVWSSLGTLGAMILLGGPLAGALAVAAMLAYQEWREIVEQPAQPHPAARGRRASTDVLLDFLDERVLATRATSRRQRTPLLGQRTNPRLLLEQLVERQPRRVFTARRRPLAPTQPDRAPHPTRLLPLTA